MQLCSSSSTFYFHCLQILGSSTLFWRFSWAFWVALLSKIATVIMLVHFYMLNVFLACIFNCINHIGHLIAISTQPTQSSSVVKVDSSSKKPQEQFELHHNFLLCFLSYAIKFVFQIFSDPLYNGGVILWSYIKLFPMKTWQLNEMQSTGRRLR